MDVSLIVCHSFFLNDVALWQIVPFNEGHQRRMQLAFGAKNAFALYACGTEENRSSTKERQL